MKLHVLFAQRRGRYKGQYGFEALAVMTEYDWDENPEYLQNAKKENTDTRAFDAIEIIELSVDEDEIKAIMFPSNKPVLAQVVSVHCAQCNAVIVGRPLYYKQKNVGNEIHALPICSQACAVADFK